MYKSEMSLVPELEGLNAPLVSPSYSSPTIQWNSKQFPWPAQTIVMCKL